MKRLTIVWLTMLSAVLSVNAAAADWYLYLWSYTNNAYLDMPQFQTTDDDNIFKISNYQLTETSVKFCVTNAAWSSTYGWAEGAAATVNTTGTAAQLGASSSANGWIGLAAGTYDITFNSSALTIRFDAVSGSEEEEREELRSFLRGGDFTYATYIEDWGAAFKYKDGTTGDLFDILESYGVNFARLRLYNKPGVSHKDGSYDYRVPYRTTAHTSGYEYAGLTDILSIARRAKAHNMKICLTLHYSDFWTNASQQRIPSEWSNATTTQALADSVAAYTTRVMQRMVAQGTTPEYVSVGNETNWGFLFGTDASHVSYGGYGSDKSKWVTLFNAAYDAIKAVSPTTQVIFHHSMGHDGGITTCQSLFDDLITNRSMHVDIIGGSYYPYWASTQNSTDNTPAGMLSWASAMETRYGKPVMIMETGYSWAQYNNPSRNGGNYEGQLSTNGSYGASLATEQGQADFMRALHEAIDSDENILGYLYWDPIFVDQQVDGSWIQTCWAEKKSGNTWYYDGNAVANTTWFDYTGLPLMALYQEVAALKESEEDTTTTETDWYLYLWSYADSAYLDMPKFQTTEDAGVFKISNYNLSQTGVQFCVTDSAWSKIYGWSSAAVAACGTPVTLATATGATGWLALPSGTYNITFNISASTIRFDYLNSEARTSAADRWGTVCLPFEVSSIENAVAYYVEGLNSNSTGLVLSEATLPLEAGKPYFYKASGENVTFNSASSNTATEAVAATGLVGNITGAKMKVPAGSTYVLSDNQLLHVSTDAVYITDRRAYVNISGLEDVSTTSAPGRVILPLPAVTTGFECVGQAQAEKLFIDGQVVIVREGVRYTLLGTAL